MALTAALPAPARWLGLPAIGAALICALPALAVLGMSVWAVSIGRADLLDPQLAPAIAGTVILVIVGTLTATILGVSAAWLVSQYQFPGRDQWAWLLVLPLAAPAYVLAYAYGALTGPMGAVPVGLSGLTGAAFVYTIAFYPYVYLAARAAFTAQSVCAGEAARTLGANPMRALFRVSLPMAWPAIAAGAALAAMEIGADYGAAAYFGAQTLSTDLFRAWLSHDNLDQALVLAGLLLSGSVVFLAVERFARGKRAFAGGSIRWRTPTRPNLQGVGALAAFGFCAALVSLGLIIPAAWLVRLAAFAPPEGLGHLGAALFNTLWLAGVAAVVTLALAAAIAWGARQRFGFVGLAAASMGYAAPGAVMALGGLLAMGAAREWGLFGGLSAGAAFGMLIWIYAARFAAAGIGPMDAGLHAVTPNLVNAARSLGAWRWRRITAVEAPIAAPGVFAAALIVFVEALKELPATLILRPFDFDTLAVTAHAYAADDRLNAAAPPALLILAAGLGPVALLMRGLAKARAGAQSA
jgi:iron(III) transport system permease protein